jgi:hypothetical protein
MRDRVFWPSIWSLVRIDHTCFVCTGGLAPIIFPLFHGTLVGWEWASFNGCYMAYLLRLGGAARCAWSAIRPTGFSEGKVMQGMAQVDPNQKSNPIDSATAHPYNPLRLATEKPRPSAFSDGLTSRWWFSCERCSNYPSQSAAVLGRVQKKPAEIV